MKNILRDSLGLALSLALMSVVSSCGQDPPANETGASTDTGAVALALQVGPDVVINNATYSIANTHNGFSSTGTVSVGRSADVPVPITGLPIADGYSITISADAGDGVTVCTGGSGFDVRANARASVVVHLVCREPPRTGSIQVAGTLNVCPLLDSLGANPDQALIGGTALLTAVAHDIDNGPQPVSYAWSTTAGTLSSATSPTPTFTCTQAGIAAITVVASDGDSNPGCPDQLTINVNCKVAP